MREEEEARPTKAVVAAAEVQEEAVQPTRIHAKAKRAVAALAQTDLVAQAEHAEEQLEEHAEALPGPSEASAAVAWLRALAAPSVARVVDGATRSHCQDAVAGRQEVDWESEVLQAPQAPVVVAEEPEEAQALVERRKG